MKQRRTTAGSTPAEVSPTSRTRTFVRRKHNYFTGENTWIWGDFEKPTFWIIEFYKSHFLPGFPDFRVL